MRNKNEYRSEFALYRKRKMMCQTRQLFVFKNRFTKIVARVAFPACLRVNLDFASFKSLTMCPRPQQETQDSKTAWQEETHPPRSQRRKWASFLFSSNHIHQIVLFCDQNSGSCLVCSSLWPWLGAYVRWKSPERRKACLEMFGLLQLETER